MAFLKGILLAIVLYLITIIVGAIVSVLAMLITADTSVLTELYVDWVKSAFQSNRTGWIFYRVALYLLSVVICFVKKY